MECNKCREEIKVGDKYICTGEVKNKYESTDGAVVMYHKTCYDQGIEQNVRKVDVCNLCSHAFEVGETYFSSNDIHWCITCFETRKKQPILELPEKSAEKKYRFVKSQQGAISMLQLEEVEEPELPEKLEPSGDRSVIEFENWLGDSVNALIDYLSHQQKEIEELKDKVNNK